MFGQAPCRILIADDYPEFRDLLKIYLGRSGYEVVAEADDGMGAVVMARFSLPDVVILDLDMPLMTGFEAIPGIRSGSPRSKIMVLTGVEVFDSTQREILETADAVVEKGPDIKDVEKVLHSLCN